MNIDLPLIAWLGLNLNYRGHSTFLFKTRRTNMRNLLPAILMLAAAPAIAEDNLKLFSTDINVRTGITFKVADTVVQKMLPAGWELNSPTAGPAKGFNLGMTLIDYVVVQDPEGKPLPLRNIIVLN